MTAIHSDATRLAAHIASIATPFVEWLRRETSPAGSGTPLAGHTTSIPGPTFEWAVWGRSIENQFGTGREDEMRERLVLAGELLYAWPPVRATFAHCAEHAASWRLLAEPDCRSQLRVTAPGLAAVLALLCGDTDSDGARAAGAVAESVSLALGDEVVLFVILEHLIRAAPRRLSLANVRKSIQRCHLLNTSPRALLVQLDIHNLTPVMRGDDWLRLLSHDQLFVADHLAARFCDDLTAFPSPQLKNWIRVLAKTLEDEPDAGPIVSKVIGRIIDVAEASNSASAIGALAELGKSSGLSELYEWSH